MRSLKTRQMSSNCCQRFHCVLFSGCYLSRVTNHPALHLFEVSQCPVDNGSVTSAASDWCLALGTTFQLDVDSALCRVFGQIHPLVQPFHLQHVAAIVKLDESGASVVFIAEEYLAHLKRNILI